MTPYFATLPATQDGLGRAVIDRVQRYFANGRVAEILGKQQIAYQYYYDLTLQWGGWNGTPGTTNMMQRGGEEGELALLRVNRCRSLVRKLISMVCNAKFSRRPRADADEYDSFRAVEQCTYALDHYTKSGGLEQRRIERNESAATLGVGYTHYGWNPYLGKEYGVDPATKRIAYTGDVETTNVLPWNVVLDAWKSWKDQRFVIVRFPKVNRYELAEKYGKTEHLRSAILEAPAQTVIPFFIPLDSGYDNWSPDDTEVFALYHLRSPLPGLERGRFAMVLGSGHVLDSGALDTDCFPLARVAEAEVMGSPFGYASFWEYLGVQELFDNLHSVIATNQSTFGVQNLIVKAGVDPRPVQMAGGMSVIVAPNPKEDIVPAQFTKSPAEIFPHLDRLSATMTELAGLSEVDLGQAQGERQSGSALALLSAQSIRNAGIFQTSDVEATKEESRIILRLLRNHATRGIRVGISERNETPYEKAITNHDLGNIDAVDIELENPLMQTAEGRVAVLQTFGQMKIPITATQAIEVVKYGNLDAATDATTKEGLRIRLENKQIAQGIAPQALLTDDHMRHCIDHKMALSDASRDDPKVREAFFKHVVSDPDSHYRLWYGTDPEADKMVGLYHVRVMALCGVTPPPPGPETAPAGPPDVQGTATPEGAPELPSGPAEGSAAGAMPRLPTNKATGEQWNPASGGGTPIQ